MPKDEGASQYVPLTQQEEDGSDDDDSEAPREKAPEQQGGSMSRLFSTRHYPALFGMGLLFDGARFSLLFLASLYVSDATGSPRFVQLTGTTMNLLLLGGPLFGIISDRYDRRRTVVLSLLSMASLTYCVSAALYLDAFRWELIYPFCLFVGLANVLDTTNRPALVYDLLHAKGAADTLSTAMALRSFGGNVGGAFAMWIVGLAVERLGMWGGFFVVATEMTLALLLLLTVPSQPPARRKGTVDKAQGSVCADMKAGLGLVATDRSLASVLGQLHAAIPTTTRLAFPRA